MWASKRVCNLHGMDFNCLCALKVTMSSLKCFVHIAACSTSPICLALLLLDLVKTEICLKIAAVYSLHLIV